MDQYITLKDLATKLNLRKGSAYRLMRQNRLPPHYQPIPGGRILFKEREIDDWMEARRSMCKT